MVIRIPRRETLGHDCATQKSMLRSSRVAFERGAGNNLSHDTIQVGKVGQILATRVYRLPRAGPYVVGRACSPGHRAPCEDTAAKWSITRWRASFCLAMRRVSWSRRK